MLRWLDLPVLNIRSFILILCRDAHLTPFPFLFHLLCSAWSPCEGSSTWSKGSVQRLTYTLPPARYNVDCTKKINIILLCNLYGTIILWSRLLIVAESNLFAPGPLNKLRKQRKNILWIWSCPEEVPKSFMLETCKWKIFNRRGR